MHLLVVPKPGTLSSGFRVSAMGSSYPPHCWWFDGCSRSSHEKPFCRFSLLSLCPELLRVSDCGLSRTREGPRAIGEDGLEGKTQQQTNEALKCCWCKKGKGYPKWASFLSSIASPSHSPWHPNWQILLGFPEFHPSDCGSLKDELCAIGIAGLQGGPKLSCILWVYGKNI